MDICPECPLFSAWKYFFSININESHRKKLDIIWSTWKHSFFHSEWHFWQGHHFYKIAFPATVWMANQEHGREVDISESAQVLLNLSNKKLFWATGLGATEQGQPLISLFWLIFVWVGIVYVQEP